MPIRLPPRIPPSAITDEKVWRNRRRLLKAAGAAGLGLGAVGLASALSGRPEAGPQRSVAGGLEPTPWKYVTRYNNFYELGTSKQDPAENAHYLKTRPWSLEVSGACERPGVVDIEEILRIPTEERIYRFRCVEAWAMVVPWEGFELRRLLSRFRPTSKAKYVEFRTLYDPERMPGQKRDILPWPYVEGLRMDEAMHPLTLIATGLYGKPLPAQNGAPLRLVVPWKYGFKSIKSIVSIRFTENQPLNTWRRLAPDEYGFYANVNPEVDHPRWSQKRERMLGEGLFAEKRPTLPFNGYGDEVAHLYRGMDLRKYF